MAKSPAKYTGPEKSQTAALEALTADGPASITVTFGDGSSQTFTAAARAFDSGSVGFYAQGPASDGSGRRMQVGINVTAVGSKNLPVK